MRVDAPAPAAPTTAPDPRLATAAREFEAVFAGEMAKLMLESVEVNGDFGGGHGETLFRGVLAEQLGRELAASGGLGIAPAVLQQMIDMQGEAR